MKSLFKFFIVFNFLTILFFSFSSCKKEGTGGNSSVSGNVKHHQELIPNAIVYIKYGATEFPGADVSVYDDKVTSDMNAHFEFKDLQKGDYYLYGVGYDFTGSYTVLGGLGIELKSNKASIVDVPVVE